MHLLAADDWFPPRLVAQVPLDGFLDAVDEQRFRQTTELDVDLREGEGVA